MPLTPALLQSILADPENDASRLHLAEILSQNDSEASRAELIRTQIRLERIDEEDRAWPELIRKERELLEANQANWERSLRNAIRPSIRTPASWLRSHLFGTGGTWGFRRGFVEQVLTSAAAFLQEDLQLFDHTPIRQVLLTNASGIIAELVREPRLDQLKSLHLVADADFDEDMQMLMESARQEGLTVNEVRLPRIDADLSGLFSQLTAGDHAEESRLSESRVWRFANAEQQDRLRELAQKPRFRHRLNEPLPTTEIELLHLSAWVWLGPDECEKVWGIAKTFHDLEDENGFRQQAILYKKPV